jgi:RND family efflux transporter MFP subunit
LPNGKEYGQEGTLDYMSSEIDPSTDTLMVRGIIANPEDKSNSESLISGQYVPVQVILGETPNSLLVPKAALVESQLGEQIYVVNSSNQVEIRNVTVGTLYKEQYVITSGLKLGEKVIVEGTQKVRANTTVKITNSESAAPASSQPATEQKPVGTPTAPPAAGSNTPAAAKN